MKPNSSTCEVRSTSLKIDCKIDPAVRKKMTNTHYHGKIAGMEANLKIDTKTFLLGLSRATAIWFFGPKPRYYCAFYCASEKASDKLRIFLSHQSLLKDFLLKILSVPFLIWINGYYMDLDTSVS